MKTNITFHYSIGKFAFKRYAIICKNERQALEIAADLESLVNVSYLRLRKSGKFDRPTVIIRDAENWKSFLNI